MQATINDTDIFFDVEGSKLRKIEGQMFEVPTIIALHGGLGFDHGYLRDGLGRLQDIAQIIYVDLRCQGRSGRPPLETATLEQMADDVAELISMLGIRMPYIFGHSAGGFVAMHLALRHPGSVAGLILTGTSPTVAPIRDEANEPTPALADRALPKTIAVAARIFSGDISAESVTEFFEEVGPYYAAPGNMGLTAILLRATSPNIDMMKHFMTKLAPQYNLTSQLHLITIPTLVLVGAYDWVCPPRASRVIARSISQSKMILFDNSGHFLFSEEPEKFRGVVADFLAHGAVLP
ncbi:alpha/beta fold hydrolase [Phyllobacterium bourgognense]|uniref:Proline iminopeptidase n=1 Tax=Phyllobacterium bourgognense TaxID=314236 RepID=A0A368YLQ9_9HYPH|nr:alpha/beta hydrolase [Phyllobacterium bourgognense]RCW81160.1 proline iminopeptidase [Phyllobacterium bourgognense]